VKLLFLYSTILSRRFILALAVGLFIAINVLSVAVEPLFEKLEKQNDPPFSQRMEE
jgi:hypothetical protein